VIFEPSAFGANPQVKALLWLYTYRYSDLDTDNILYIVKLRRCFGTQFISFIRRQLNLILRNDNMHYKSGGIVTLFVAAVGIDGFDSYLSTRLFIDVI
jgi:hypothetical protein